MSQVFVTTRILHGLQVGSPPIENEGAQGSSHTALNEHAGKQNGHQKVKDIASLCGTMIALVGLQQLTKSKAEQNYRSFIPEFYLATKDYVVPLSF